MTDVRRLAQSVIITGFVGTTVPDWLSRRLDEGLAGVCWFAHNVTDAEQARRLADDLHARRPGVLVMSDEEGGDVTRLEAETGSSWPGHATLGALDDVDATGAVATAMGAQLRAAGIDVALAPVVDVNSNPDNPVIGVRSFGSTAELVGRHGAAFVHGIQSAGVAACAKHFPGHGSTFVDSHLGLPRVDDPVELLRERDLAPFAAVVEAGVRCVMTAHVVFSAFDELPATLSPALIALLRGELGFGGLVISDAIDMQAISKGVGRGEGAVRTLAAGVDLVCIGNPGFPAAYDAQDRLDEVVSAVVGAVSDGRLSTDRLEQAAGRVAELDGWLRGRPEAVRASRTEIGRGVAARALQVRGDVAVTAGTPVVVDLRGAVNIAAGRRGRHVADALTRRDPSAEVVAVDGSDGLDQVLVAATRRPLVVLSAERTNDGRLSTLLAARPDAVVVHTGLADVEAPGEHVVWTRGGGRAVGEVVADLLLGEVRR
jgi:beta-N-acetylhexosaminidase